MKNIGDLIFAIVLLIGGVSVTFAMTIESQDACSTKEMKQIEINFPEPVISSITNSKLFFNEWEWIDNCNYTKTSTQTFSIFVPNGLNCMTFGPDASGGHYQICW